MKVQIDIDGELWTKFREKVFYCGKLLRDVVPTVIEPALKEYLETHGIPSKYVNKCDKCGQEIRGVEFLSGDGMTKLCMACMNPSELPTVDRIKEAPGFAKAIVETFHPTFRRCELCDMPTDKVFASGPYKVCYSCWKSASNNAQSSAQTSFSSDAGVPQSKPQQ